MPNMPPMAARASGIRTSPARVERCSILAQRIGTCRWREEADGRVADHAAVIARRVSGVAQIEQFRLEAAAQGHLQQSVHRSRSARLVMS